MTNTIITVVATTIILGGGYAYHSKLSERAIEEAVVARDAIWQKKFDDAKEDHRETSAAIVQSYITVDDNSLDDEFTGVYGKQSETTTDCECAGELQTYKIGPYTGPDQFKDSQDRSTTSSQDDTTMYDGQIIYRDITNDTCDDFENEFEIIACKELLQ